MDTFARDNLPPREQWPVLFELEYPERLNAAEELLSAPWADRPCVVGGEETWTYAELRSRAEGIARVLVEEQGLEPGNRVLLHGFNDPQLIACWFGVLLAGGIAVATMPMLRAGELAKVISRAQVSHGLVDARLAGEVRKAGGPLRALLTFEEATATPGAFEPVATSRDDVALIAFTSGTTGEPKGCVHFHRDVLAICDTFARSILDPSPEDVFTGTAPLAFTFGLGVLVLFPMRFGASLVPIPTPGMDPLVQTILRHEVTTLATAPTMYRTLLRAGPDLPSLRACISAGEPLPAGVARAWHERTGIRIVDGIGSTEMLHIFIAARAEASRYGSVGTPVPGYEAIVVGPDMERLPAGEVGRLAVRGPTGCRYLADPRQADYVVDGWNLTGDAFRVDEDGYFWFEARNDDLIVSAGYNISPFEVETALLEHEAVAECAVVASPDEDRGHVVKAFVVLAEGTAGDAALAEALQNHVKQRIAPYKYPRRVEFLDALPRTPTGKVQRSALRGREA
ncbi:MAG TPA: AMP-binding protein [Solirubrobacteraceae bacterium]|nr:AMP-binding protein [Solirubrobacteraceae bacterium]